MCDPIHHGLAEAPADVPLTDSLRLLRFKPLGYSQPKSLTCGILRREVRNGFVRDGRDQIPGHPAQR